MKFEVNRLIMLEAAKTTAKIAPSNAHTDVLNGILVECSDDTGEVFLTATNHEVAIQQKVIASVKESGTMLINARMLVGMMSLLAGEFVTLSADRPDLLTATSGRSRYQINCLPATGYPNPIMPFPEESVFMTGICSLAKRTTFLVSTDERKPALQCVNIKLKNNAVHAAASDGLRMMLIKDSSDSTEEREFLLPGYSLKMLASISEDSDMFEVGDIGKHVVFVRGDMIFTIRKLTTDTYMDTSALIKRVNPVYSAVTEAGKMKEALGLISVGALAGKTHAPINLAMLGNEIALSCKTDLNEGSAIVPANVSRETPESGFFYDVTALLKLFNVLSGKVKLELDAKGFIMIKTRNEVYLQSPIPPNAVNVINELNAKYAKPTKDKESAKGAEGVKKEKAA